MGNRKLLIFGIILILTLPVLVNASTYSQIVNKLISYYSFDTNSNDNYNKNNLYVNGSLSLVSPCKINGCYNSTGAGFLYSNKNFTNITPDISFSFWYYGDLKAYDPVQDKVYLSRGYQSVTGRPEFYETRFKYYNKFYTTAVNAPPGVGTTRSEQYKLNVTNNAWHFFVSTYNSTSTIMKACIDNLCNSTLRAGADTSLSNNDRFKVFSLGNQPLSQYNTRGFIDEVSIWNRTLSQSEINNLYNGGNGINFINYALNNCSTGTNNTIITNFTFRNEVNNALVTASTSISNFNYINYVGVNTLYQNNVNLKTQMSLCAKPYYKSFTGSYQIYYSATNYPQRRYVNINALYQSPQSFVTLYLLNTTSGSYFYVRVFDSYNNPLQNVTVTMQKQFNGTGAWYTVDQESSDSSGSVTLFGSTTTYYRITVSKTGYADNVFTLAPPIPGQTYNIKLSSQGNNFIQGLETGLTYSFTPVSSTPISTHTNYTFGFRLYSNYNLITNCQLVLYSGSKRINIKTGTYNNTNCNASFINDSLTYTNLYLYANVTLNSTYTLTFNNYYTTESLYIGDVSLFRAFSNFANYNGHGFSSFWKSLFAVGLILSIVIFLNKYTDILTSIKASLIVISVLMFILSAFNMFYINFDGIPSHFLKQYILAIIVFMVSATVIIDMETR